MTRYAISFLTQVIILLNLVGCKEAGVGKTTDNRSTTSAAEEEDPDSVKAGVVALGGEIAAELTPSLLDLGLSAEQAAIVSEAASTETETQAGNIAITTQLRMTADQPSAMQKSASVIGITNAAVARGAFASLPEKAGITDPELRAKAVTRILNVSLRISSKRSLDLDESALAEATDKLSAEVAAMLSLAQLDNENLSSGLPALTSGFLDGAGNGFGEVNPGLYTENVMKNMVASIPSLDAGGKHTVASLIEVTTQKAVSTLSGLAKDDEKTLTLLDAVLAGASPALDKITTADTKNGAFSAMLKGAVSGTATTSLAQGDKLGTTSVSITKAALGSLTTSGVSGADVASIASYATEGVLSGLSTATNVNEGTSINTLLITIAKGITIEVIKTLPEADGPAAAADIASLSIKTVAKLNLATDASKTKAVESLANGVLSALLNTTDAAASSDAVSERLDKTLQTMIATVTGSNDLNISQADAVGAVASGGVAAAINSDQAKASATSLTTLTSTIVSKVNTSVQGQVDAGTVSATSVTEITGKVDSAVTVAVEEAKSAGTITDATATQVVAGSTTPAFEWDAAPKNLVAVEDSSLKVTLKTKGGNCSSVSFQKDASTTCNGSGGPEPLSVSTAGTFAWTPQQSDVGSCDLVIKATCGTATLSLTVAAAVSAFNDGPQFVTFPTGTYSVATLGALNLASSATDEDNANLTYTISGAVFATIISSTGAITISPLSTDVGSYPMTLTVSDGSKSASKTFTVNVTDAPPTLSFSYPVDNLTTGEPGTGLSMTWSANDNESNALIDLYRKTSNTGNCDLGTSITTGLAESSTGYTSTLPSVPGYYYFCAKISDGVNPAVHVHSGKVSVYDSFGCSWTGVADNAWTNAANWLNCGGAAPITSSWVNISSGAPNQPTISANTQIMGFGPATALTNGTVTIAAGVTFTLSGGNPAPIRSSVTIAGDTTACSNCYLNFANSSFSTSQPTVANNATLSLVSGSTLKFNNSGLYVGGSSGIGHFKTQASPGVPVTEWPMITAGVGQFYGVTVTGTGTGTRSSVQIDGLRINNVSTLGTGYSALLLNDFWNVLQMDRLQVAVSGGVGSAGIRIMNCGGGVVADTTWSDFNFTSLMFRNIDALSCSGIGPISMTNGSGPGFGPGAENDVNNIFNWASTTEVCTWTGSLDTAWNNPGNWTGCINGRSNFPDENDRVVITSGANQPVLTAPVAVRAVAPGTGNGIVTITPGTSFFIIEDTSSGGIRSDIRFQGSPASCTTCEVLTYRDLRISQDAYLTLYDGITVKVGTAASYKLYVGDATTPGHLVTSGTTIANYPRITFRQASFGGVKVEGPVGTPSSLNLSGLRILDTYLAGSTYTGIEIGQYVTIDSFNGVEVDPSSNGFNAGSSAIKFSSCVGQTLNSVTWADLVFPVMPTAAYNVSVMDLVNCLTPISLGGSGAGYGASYENDAGAILSWP